MESTAVWARYTSRIAKFPILFRQKLLLIWTNRKNFTGEKLPILLNWIEIELYRTAGHFRQGQHHKNVLLVPMNDWDLINSFDTNISLMYDWYFLFLPTAYVVRGKVMFWHVSVHPSVCPRGGGGPARSNGGGVTRGGVPSSRGYTPSRQGYPRQGYPRQDNRWSTWYAAVGMPLEFRQEDFLVCQCFQ